MPDITLLTTRGDVHDFAGLNWGLNPRNHTRPLDAYIPIHIAAIRNNPGLFRPKTRTQTIINFRWDDGTRMQGLFEGTQTDRATGRIYPKQISSSPNKDTLGKYFRRRLGITTGRKILLQNLHNYGRTTVTITRIDASNYHLVFHV